jgi:hypothetical protein
VHYHYGISARGDQEGRVRYRIRPAASREGGRVALIRHWIAVEQDAPAVLFLDQIGLRVTEGEDPPTTGATPGVVYLQTRNDPRDKECAIFLLPEIEGEQVRQVEMQWRWEGGFARLLNVGEEEVLIELRSADPIPEVKISFAIEAGLAVECTVVDLAGRSFEPPSELGRATRADGPVAVTEGGETRWSYRLEGASSGVYALCLTSLGPQVTGGSGAG